MRKRQWTVRPTHVRFLLAAALLPLGAWGCDSSSGSSKEASKPEVEQNPANAATLPAAPEVAVNTAANDSARTYPLDATPSPDGKDVYYIALVPNEDGDPLATVLHTSADGGDVQTLTSGAPLASPVGITTSLDGGTLFVSDPGTAGGGGILAIPSGGGAATLVDGTAGYRPQGVTVAKVKTKTNLYFTGVDPSSGDAGVFSVDPAGGTVTSLATGAPFGVPGGVVVLPDGTVYVADSASENGAAAIIAVNGDGAKTFVDGIGVGFPAGITSTRDGATLLVSGLDPATHTDVVYFVDSKSAQLSVLTDTINAFHTPAGVHRAHDTDVFAWADSRANESGTVFVLKP